MQSSFHKKNWEKRLLQKETSLEIPFVKLIDVTKPPVVITINNDNFRSIYTKDNVYEYIFVLIYNTDMSSENIDIILNTNGYILMQNQKFAIKEKHVGEYISKHFIIVLDMTKQQYDNLSKVENNLNPNQIIVGSSFYISNLQPSNL